MKIKHLIRKVTLNMTLVVAMLLPLGVTSYAYADTPTNDVCSAISDSGSCTGSGNGININKVTSLVINIMSVLVGFAAVVMLILAASRFISSGGDSSKVAAAKSTIIYAIVGLVIVALAQVIVHFVLANAKSVGG